VGEGEALQFCWRLVERLVRHGALVSLFWHNNFFNEPEYWDWQMVHEKLRERRAGMKPWSAPGAEINGSIERREDGWRGRLGRLPAGACVSVWAEPVTT
jgi:hypothetical protein